MLCGVVAIAVMDLSVVNVALPSIETNLGISPASLQWVVVTYGIAVAGLLMLGGRIGDLFGHRRMLLGGLVVLAAASLLGGFADSLTVLIVARAGQGMGAAFAVPNALGILSRAFAEGPERTRALGIFGAAGGTAAIGGSILGGLLVEGPGWTWVFFVNVPLAAAIVAAGCCVLPADATALARRGRVDLAGAITLTTGLVALAFGIHQSVEHTWVSTPTLLPLAIGVGALVAFGVAQARVAEPLVPLRTLTKPSLLWANVASALMWAAFLGLIYAAALFTQQVLGWSPLAASSSTIPIAVLSILGNAVLAPRSVSRFGPAGTLAGGLLLMAAGLALLLRVPSDASFLADIAPVYCLIGLGIGFAEVGSQVAAFSGIGGDEAGMAGGALETAREMGGALGLAVLTAVAVTATNGTESFHRIAAGAAIAALAGWLVAATLLRRTERTPVPPEPAPAGV